MADIAFLSEQWLGLTRPYLPGSDNLLVVAELRKAARRFLTDVRVLKTPLGPLDINGAVTPVYLVTPTVPTGTEIVSADDIRYLDRKLRDGVRDVFKRHTERWDKLTAEEPTYWLMEDENTIRLYPGVEVDTVAALTGTVFLRPTLDADGVDERIYKRYGEIVAAACISSMCAMKGKPWTDAMQAGDYERRYNRGMGDARIFVLQSGGEAEMSVLPSLLPG